MLSNTFGGQDKILSNKPVYQELSSQHYLLKYLTFKTSQQIVPCSLFQLPGVILNSHCQELPPTSPSDRGCLALGQSVFSEISGHLCLLILTSPLRAGVPVTSGVTSGGR